MLKYVEVFAKTIAKKTAHNMDFESTVNLLLKIEYNSAIKGVKKGGELWHSLLPPLPTHPPPPSDPPPNSSVLPLNVTCGAEERDPARYPFSHNFCQVSEKISDFQLHLP